MPKVYVPQQPSKFDSATRLWIPTMNLDSAKRYGDITVLLPPNANRLNTAPLVNVIKVLMGGYTIDDFIVAVGDPSLIGICVAIASRATGGKFNMLKWDRLTSDYIKVEVAI
jgi:hypothetical protein